MLHQFGDLVEPGDKCMFFYQNKSNLFVYHIRNMDKKEIEQAMIAIYHSISGGKDNNIFDINPN